MLVKEVNRTASLIKNDYTGQEKIYDFSSLIIPVCKKSAMICSTR